MKVSVIRCETCKGTGKVEIKKPFFPMEGSSVDALRQYEESMACGLYNIKYETCPNCGGSGCRWVTDEQE